MVFLGVSVKGCTELVFVPQGVKVKAQNYIDDILEKVILPLKEEVLGETDWTFQQDSAPAHKARVTQRWLRTFRTSFDMTNGLPLLQISTLWTTLCGPG